MKDSVAGRISKQATGEIGTMAPPDAPKFSKGIAAYRRLIDEAYDKRPRTRSQSVPLLMMCLADVPVLACEPDER